MSGDRARPLSGIRLLVTGAAGFIGSNLTERLCRDGAEVLMYDNLSSGKRGFVERLKELGAGFAEGDVLDRHTLLKAMKSHKPYAVFHFAANPAVSAMAADPVREGIASTYSVLECMRLASVRRMVFPSSQSVYGNAAIRPTPESYGPLRPISMYASMKLASEALISSFSHMNGLDFNIFRLGNVVGRNMTHGAAYDFVRKLKNNGKVLDVLGSGAQKKDYVDIDDAIGAILYIVGSEKRKNDIFNVGSVDQISVREIAEMAVEKVSKGARIRYQKNDEGWPGDIVDNFISIDKLIGAGFTPRMNSSQAISNALDSILENWQE